MNDETPFRKATLHLAIIIGLLSGLAVAVVLVPSVMSSAGINQRQRVIHSAITGGQIDGIFLGNSVTMNAVDASVVSENVREWSNIINASSGGQSFFESALLLDNVSSPVGLVVLCITAPTETAQQDDETVLSKYHFAGYAPSPELTETASRCENAVFTNYFLQSGAARAAHGRWTLTYGINSFFRKTLRKDLDLERSDNDLFYPGPYTRKVANDKIEKLLSLHYDNKTLPDMPSAILIEIIKYMKQRTESLNASFVLTILPSHPYLFKRFGKDNMSRLIQAIPEQIPDIVLINYFDALTEDDFNDHIHPDRNAAVRLSAQIGRDIDRLLGNRITE